MDVSGGGRKARRGKARRLRPLDLYGGRRRVDEGQAPESKVSPGNLDSLREQAWEVIRRYPDDERVVLKACQVLVQVAFAERVVGTPVEQLAQNFQALQEHLGKQLLPPGWEEDGDG